MTFRTSFSEMSLLAYRIGILSYFRENAIIILVTNTVFIFFCTLNPAFPKLMTLDLKSTLLAATIVLNIFIFILRPLQIAAARFFKKEYDHFDFEYNDGSVTIGLRNKNTSGTFPEIMKIKEYREYVEFKLTKSFKFAVPRENFPQQEYRAFIVK